MDAMTRLDLAGYWLTRGPQPERDPRNDLSDLAAGFELQFEPDALRRILADAADLSGDEWQEIRSAIKAAITAAEHPRPKPPPIGVPAPEGVRFEVYASADSRELLGEVVTGPDGYIDLSHLADVETEIGRRGAGQLFLKQIDVPRYPTD